MTGSLEVMIVSKDNLNPDAERLVQLHDSNSISKLKLVQPRKPYILRKYNTGVELTNTAFNNLKVKGIIEDIAALPVNAISIWGIRQIGPNTIACDMGIIGVEHLAILRRCRSTTGVKEVVYDTAEYSIGDLFIRARKAIIDRDASICKVMLENTSLSTEVEQFVVSGNCNGGLLRTNIRGINLLINVNTGTVSKPYSVCREYNRCVLNTIDGLIELLGCMYNDTDCEVSFRIHLNSGEKIVTSRKSKNSKGVTNIKINGYSLMINLESGIMKVAG